MVRKVSKASWEEKGTMAGSVLVGLGLGAVVFLILGLLAGAGSGDIVGSVAAEAMRDDLRAICASD